MQNFNTNPNNGNIEKKPDSDEELILKKYKSKIYIFAILIIIVFAIFKIGEERENKKQKEINGILKKVYTNNFCVQYALIATINDYYVCYECNNKQIYLKAGEVWKYGKTCNGVFGRYPDGLPYPNLKFVVQFEGTEAMCLIEEKHKIYSYTSLPECINRTIKLIRPPGNKIDR